MTLSIRLWLICLAVSILTVTSYAAPPNFHGVNPYTVQRNLHPGSHGPMPQQGNTNGNANANANTNGNTNTNRSLNINSNRLNNNISIKLNPGASPTGTGSHAVINRNLNNGFSGFSNSGFPNNGFSGFSNSGFPNNGFSGFSNSGFPNNGFSGFSNSGFPNNGFSGFPNGISRSYTGGSYTGGSYSPTISVSPSAGYSGGVGVPGVAGMPGVANNGFVGFGPPQPAGNFDENNPNTAWLTLDLPNEQADVWLNGVKMQHRGLTRKYVTPPLNPGLTYNYEVKVVWPDKVAGNKQYITTLNFKAGDEIYHKVPDGGPPIKK